MVAAGRFPQIYLPLIGVGVAALWPLTAYALSPNVFLIFQGSELALLYVCDVYKVIAEVG